jgi:preprotein translocase subunit SecA
VEARNFEIRKHLLEYDDVMNKQRKEIYRFRRELLEGKDQKPYILNVADELVQELLGSHVSLEEDPRNWDFEGLGINFQRIFGLGPPQDAHLMDRPELDESLGSMARQRYEAKEAEIGPEVMRWYERMIMLQIIDQQWKDHLLALDHLKEGIGLRGYGQRDPLVEYKRESFELFEDLWNRSTEEMVRMLYLLRPISAEDERELRGAHARRQQQVSYSGPESAPPPRRTKPRRTKPGRMDARSAAAVKTVVRTMPKVGRNKPCPCGSGKKYKKCCGR